MKQDGNEINAVPARIARPTPNNQMSLRAPSGLVIASITLILTFALMVETGGLCWKTQPAHDQAGHLAAPFDAGLHSLMVVFRAFSVKGIRKTHRNNLATFDLNLRDAKLKS